MARLIANDRESYGWLSIALHWLMALGIVALFWLGLYMVDLGYYDSWYNRAPRLHESIGLLLGFFLVIRFVARLANPPPRPLDQQQALVQLAIAVHWLFYLLIFAIITSGYLVSSAGGASVGLFDYFSLPPLLDLPQQEDIAGIWHRRLAWVIVLLAVVHSLAALKHHFIDRDRSLLRILGIRKNNRRPT